MVNPKKITKLTPEELVQIYNPMAGAPEPMSPVNRKANMDMHKEISASARAESVVPEILNPDKQMLMHELVEIVKKGAGVGIRNATLAITSARVMTSFVF